MPHILVSDIDNPSYAYSISIISVLSKNKEFNNKGMYGIDCNGKQTIYTNGVDVKHYLIKDCSADEFIKAMLNSDHIKSPVAFRVVNDEFVVKKPFYDGEWPRNKVDLEKVLQNPCISSIQKPETNEIKPKLLCS